MPSKQKTTPWWHGAVIYQIYPRSFLDTNDDGVGDLNGITKRLDHVASLGVDAIWISPFFSSPMDDFGYDVSDYCAVDPIFGNLNDFDDLLERAHAIGLKVIIDQVYSHTSSKHAWFAESRQNKTNDRSNWYVWADPKSDGSPPNNWQSVFGGSAWEWDGRRKQYFLHNFLASQPDLNLHNNKVQDALLDVARFWLDRGVDGFRMDAINFAMHDPRLFNNPPSNRPMTQVTRSFDMQLHKYNQSHHKIGDFLTRLGNLCNDYGDIFTVAEVVGPEPFKEMCTFTRPGRLSSAYNFDFLYLDQLAPKTIKDSISPWLAAPEHVPSWAFSNHDAPRIATRWSVETNFEAYAKFHMLLLLSLPGIAFIYQGEELALPQGVIPFEQLVDPEAIKNWPHTLGRDGARTPIPWSETLPFSGFSSVAPWLPISDAQRKRSVDAQTAKLTSMLHFTREALNIRGNYRALQTGNFEWLDAPKDLLLFTRTSDDTKFLCAFNFGDHTVNLAGFVTGEVSPILRTNDAPLDLELEPMTGAWYEARKPT